MSCCGEGKSCNLCGKLIDLCGGLLLLWALGYTINSIVKVVVFWNYYPFFFLFKLFIFRLGISLAAALFASTAMYLHHHGCPPKVESKE